MSEEGRVIVRSPSLNPTKIAGSPHWHPAIQACVIPERRGIVALVRRLIWKKIPERPVAGSLDRGQAGSLPAPLGSPFRAPQELARAQTFFQIFCRAAPLRAPLVFLIDCNHSIFRDNPLCDDLLTIGVDSPEGGAYNPNH